VTARHFDALIVDSSSARVDHGESIALVDIDGSAQAGVSLHAGFGEWPNTSKTVDGKEQQAHHPAWRQGQSTQCRSALGQIPARHHGARAMRLLGPAVHSGGSAADWSELGIAAGPWGQGDPLLAERCRADGLQSFCEAVLTFLPSHLPGGETARLRASKD
jgi:hypothetical protein